MSFSKADNVVEALANLIAEQLTSGSLDLMEAGKVIRVDVNIPGGNVVLRTDKGETWYVTPIQLGSRARLTLDNGNPPAYECPEVRQSHAKYQALLGQWEVISKVVEAVGTPDLDTALQAWVEDVLSEEDREVWYRWSSGGYATKQEWLVINAYSN